MKPPRKSKNIGELQQRLKESTMNDKKANTEFAEKVKSVKIKQRF